jgi:hypothetical protein
VIRRWRLVDLVDDETVPGFRFMLRRNAERMARWGNAFAFAARLSAEPTRFVVRRWSEMQ